MKKVIVTGSNGQLGKEFRDYSDQESKIEFFFFDRQGLDITDKKNVEETFRVIKPDYVVNCAAYTAVDKAEIETEAALLVNRDAVANMAGACAQEGIHFLHISTDYVYDGTATKPLKEDDPTNPVNTYGKSKLEGEQKATEFNRNSIIIRTSWVYSAYGNNFVKTMLRLMSSRPEISVVADQRGSPTYAADLANAIMQIIQSERWIPGTYHYSNDGIITWFDFASEIKQLSGASCTVHAITTEQYPTPARRPAYSGMDKTKIQQTFGIELKDWKNSLKVCLQRLS